MTLIEIEKRINDSLEMVKQHEIVFLKIGNAIKECEYLLGVCNCDPLYKELRLLQSGLHELLKSSKK